jgi:hypothetical protein
LGSPLRVSVNKKPDRRPTGFQDILLVLILLFVLVLGQIVAEKEEEDKGQTIC